jgi:hypothetical protein
MAMKFQAWRGGKNPGAGSRVYLDRNIRLWLLGHLKQCRSQKPTQHFQDRASRGAALK